MGTVLDAINGMSLMHDEGIARINITAESIFLELVCDA
jgi:hypothetical protein